MPSEIDTKKDISLFDFFDFIGFGALRHGVWYALRPHKKK
jgi:hypothetical protein